MIASSGKMMLDFFAVLDLLAARTGHALPRTVVLEVLCDLTLSIEPFATVSRALYQPGLALLLEVQINLVVTEYFRAVVRMVWAAERQASQLFTEKLVDLARLEGALLTTIATDVAFLESAGLTEDVVAVRTLDRGDDDILALRTAQILLNIDRLSCLA